MTLFARLAMAAALLASAFPARAADLNDYPTVARSDFVFACMKTNNDTREALERCSCAIDVIATILPYKDYVEAETVASMKLATGVVATQFKSTVIAKEALDALFRARAEAEVRCF